jgi:hypothetical protein
MTRVATPNYDPITYTIDLINFIFGKKHLSLG